jgi:hypothetical protein
MGQDECELKSLADDQLLSGLERVVSRRNQITAEFLAYLAKLDERQLFLDLGYYPFGYHEARSSLFEYCVEKLGLCESTAGLPASGHPRRRGRLSKPTSRSEQSHRGALGFVVGRVSEGP